MEQCTGTKWMNSINLLVMHTWKNDLIKLLMTPITYKCTQLRLNCKLVITISHIKNHKLNNYPNNHIPSTIATSLPCSQKNVLSGNKLTMRRFVRRLVLGREVHSGMGAGSRADIEWRWPLHLRISHWETNTRTTKPIITHIPNFWSIPGL